MGGSLVVDKKQYIQFLFYHHGSGRLLRSCKLELSKSMFIPSRAAGMNIQNSTILRFLSSHAK